MNQINEKQYFKKYEHSEKNIIFIGIEICLKQDSKEFRAVVDISCKNHEYEKYNNK
jgi:hypothetical protein